MDSEFGWDETKRQANQRKHGVDVADAVELFYDDLSCSMQDPDHHAEQRFLITGMDAFGRVLLVVYAQPDEQTLISEALRKHIERRSDADLESTLLRVLREELTAANP